LTLFRHFLTFGVIGLLLDDTFPWLPWWCIGDVCTELAGVDVENTFRPDNGIIGGRLNDDVNELLLVKFKWFVRSSKFSRSSDACCNFSSLIADMSSSFCVSNDERDNIS
jgi:hypothetical protein